MDLGQELDEWTCITHSSAAAEQFFQLFIISDEGITSVLVTVVIQELPLALVMEIKSILK